MKNLRFALRWLCVVSSGAVPALAADDLGRITLSPTGEIIAGSRVTLTFTYIVGARGMKKGGSLRLATPNEDWSFPLVPLHRNFLPDQQRSGKDGGYVSYARSDVKVKLESAARAWIDLVAETRASIGRIAMGSTRNIVATVHDADLAPGDKLTVIYGDKSLGELGAQVQRMAPTERDVFRAFVDVVGDGNAVELASPDFAKLRVVAGPVAQFNVVAPAIVRPGEPFIVKIAGVDTHKNRPTGTYAGELRVSASRAGLAMPGTVAFSAADANRREIAGVRALTEGIHRIAVEPVGGGERSISNPIWCTSSPTRIYFGDLHVHGKWHSNSYGTPAELYEYGRDVSSLDFMGVTDMYGYRKEGWPETMAATRQYHAPGRFVTFKGFEYGTDVGHRNVIYRDCADEPALSKLPQNDPKALFAYYRGRDVIIIPHHTKVWTEWEYHDPVLAPIVEAYSAWGSGVEEVDPLWHKAIKPGSGLFAALARGYRLGFIGSSDSHTGMPGRSYPADRFWCVDSKGGYACVMATELTRESVFDALRQRRCYATTGVRMILEFSVNDVGMGQTLPLATPRAVRRIAVHAIGTELASLRVLKNNREFAQRALTGDEACADFYDTEPAKTGDFYFIRVVQKDQNTGWSSPVWVNVPGGPSG